MEKEEYIRILTEQIRCKEARAAVAEEVENHIEDAAETYEEFGISKEKAYEKAVQQMGDPVQTGVELDRIHRPRFEWKLFGLILVLSALGLLVQYWIGQQTGWNILVRQCFYTLVGIAVMLAVYLLDYTVLGRYTWFIYWGYVAVLFLCRVMSEVYGYRFQGSIMREFIVPMYLFVPLAAGILYYYRGSGYQGLMKCLGSILVPIVICIWSIHSIQTAMNLAGIFFLMLLFAIGKGWFAVKKKRTIGILTAGFFVIPTAWLILGMRYFFAEYQKARLLAMTSSYEDGYNYVKLAIQEMLGRCQMIGAAAVNQSDAVEGTTGVSILADAGLAHTEYVFIQLLSSFGILAGMIVILLLALLIVKVFHISMKQKNQLGMMIGVGCGLVFLVQILEYVLMNLGIGLQSTVFLPFFSYGDLSVVVFYVLMGLVLSIYRYKDIPRKTGEKKSRALKMRIWVE